MRATLAVTALAIALVPHGTPSSASGATHCMGAPVTIRLTTPGQTYQGTDGNDVIFAEAAGITAFGGAGNDLICGGDGTQILDGGIGDDSLVGGPGDDVVAGGLGGDSIGTSPGNDALDAGEGRDELFIGSETEFYRTGVRIDTTAGTLTGDGVDTISGFEDYDGTNTDDVFRGNASDESFYSERGTDLIDGQGGDDDLFAVRSTLIGGTGDDVLTAINGGTAAGGAGDDELVLATEDEEIGGPTTPFKANGGGDDDRIVLAGAVDQGGDPLPMYRHNSKVRGGPGADVLSLAYVRFAAKADLALRRATWRNGLVTWKGTEAFEGSRRPDVIRGTRGPDHI